MNSKCVIYGLFCMCHDDGVRYVGQTSKGMTARFTVHLAHSESVKSPVYNWIRKHGKGNIAYTVLEVCLPTELDAREECWIAFYREQIGAKLMNVKLGGANSAGHKRPAQSGRMRGDGNPMWGLERKEIMAHARSFQEFDSNYFSAMAKGRLGYKHRDESIEKIRDGQKASWTDERKVAAAEARSGSRNPQTKLTDGDVHEIRRLREEEGLAYNQISRMYGMTSGAISMICRRITWKHVE